MPPGTSDLALNVFQSVPLDGIIIVSSPQDLVKMIVGKAVNMANQMKINIIGLVENMSYMVCPCCGEKIYPFGESKLESVAKFYNIKPLKSFPINPKYAELVDKGLVEDVDTSFMDDVRKEIEKL
jgi:Mrp family chromosome partitioning ATPase